MPNDLCCPISRELFTDPVVAKDGSTYEREAIEEWLREKKTSPITRAPLNSSELYPNLAIKSMADSYRDERRAINAFYKYKMDVDVKKSTEEPMITNSYKSVYRVEWVSTEALEDHSKITLSHYFGDHAKRIADTYKCLTPHPNLLRTYGAVRPEGPDLSLIQEDIGDRTLADFVEESVPQSVALLNRILSQIIAPLKHLASAKITHGAVTLDNVVIFSIDAEHNDVIVKLRNIGEYSHVVSTGSYSEKPDVFAFGILALVLYSLADDGIDKDMNDGLSPAEVFERCTSDDPKERPSFHELSVILRQWLE